jgi:hypothetical protein
MAICIEAMQALGRALLPVAVALLFEELTCGGLVRLILAPRPRSAQQTERNNNGEKPCSH